MERILSLILIISTSYALNIAENPKVDANCLDLYGSKKCELLRDKWGFCKFAEKNRMEELCKKTCGVCTAQAIDCSKTDFKCCADGTTPKSDAQGSNCQPCEDKHEELCLKYAKDCNDAGWAGQWMHHNCRKTCLLCKVSKPACKDDEYQEEFCPKWKLYGMCNENGSLMKKYCRKTCNFCHLEEIQTELPRFPLGSTMN